MHRHLTWLTALALAAPGFAAPAAAGPGAEGLRCRWQAPAQVAAGEPVPLHFTISNTGGTALWVLTWNTPFEDGGWFGPYVEVQRQGEALRYQGPMMKRGDPQRDDYLRLAPGASHSAVVDLSLPFDLSQPGRYRVQPRLRLHDVTSQAPSRPRSAHALHPLDCEALEIEVLQPRGARRAAP